MKPTTTTPAPAATILTIDRLIQVMPGDLAEWDTIEYDGTRTKHHGTVINTDHHGIIALQPNGERTWLYEPTRQLDGSTDGTFGPLANRIDNPTFTQGPNTPPPAERNPATIHHNQPGYTTKENS